MDSNIINIQPESDEISLKDVFSKFRNWAKFIRQRWIYVLVFALIGGIAGYLYAKSKKTLYIASTTFVLEEAGTGGGGLGQYAGLASMAGIDIGGGGGGIFQGDNILELYRSRHMIEKTLLSQVLFNNKKELLINRYLEFNNMNAGWNSLFDANSKLDSSGRSIRLRDSIISIVVKRINKSNLDVSKPDKKLSIIRANVTSADEFFSKTFNDQIVKNVNDFYVQTKTKKSLENVLIMQQKTDSVRNVMNGAISTAAIVSDATPNLNPSRQSQRVVAVQKSQFSAETNKSILGELVKNLELSKISLRKEKPLIQVVDQPVFPLETEKFSPVKGVLMGVLIFGFLSVFYFTIKLMFIKSSHE